MKILVLIGSLRKDSYHRKLYEAYKALNSDFNYTEGRFDDFPYYNEDIEKAAIPKEVLRLNEQIHTADAILFFSPEYNYSIPGALKNAVDWLSRIKAGALQNKPAAIIGASPGRIATARMQYDFRKVGLAIGLQLLGKPEVMVSEVHKLFEGDQLMDEATKEHLKKHASALKKLVQQQ